MGRTAALSARCPVSEKHAEDHDLAVGGVVPMRFADGASTDLTVAAVYELRDTVGDLMITSDDRSWLAWSPPCGRPRRGAQLDILVAISSE